MRKVRFIIMILCASWFLGCGSSGTKLTTPSPSKQESEAVLASLVSNEVAVIDPKTDEIVGVKNVGAWGEYTNNHFDLGAVMWFNNGRNVYAVRADDFDLITSAFGYPQFGPQQLLMTGTSTYKPSCHIDTGNRDLLTPLQVAQPIAKGIENFSLETTFIDVTPDGRYVYASRRGEDEICVLDNNFGTQNFGKVIRCINVVTGKVKDANGNVIRTYQTLYTPAGGPVAGGNRGIKGSAGRCDINQNTCRAGVCDASIVLRDDGKVIFCEPDWYGGTVTCLDITDNDKIYQYLLPVLVKNSIMPGGFMGTVSINMYNGRSYYFTENLDTSMGSDPCRGHEYVLDVTDLSNIRLVQMIVPRFSCLDGIDSDDLTNGQTYQIRVRYIYSYNYDQTGRVSGIANQQTYNVNYVFRKASGFVSTGYLEKVNSSDPGPSYITDGIPIAPFTDDMRPVNVLRKSNGNVVKGDEVYIVGITPGYGQVGVVSYRGFAGNGNPPFPVSHRINLVYNTTSAVMTFTSDGRKVFINDRANPIIYVIDTFTKSISDIIPVPAASQALTTKSMIMPTKGATTPPPSGGGGGGGGGPLPMPCGG